MQKYLTTETLLDVKQRSEYACDIFKELQQLNWNIKKGLVLAFLVEGKFIREIQIQC